MSICTKCGGAGILDWTDNDGGICYKCEGLGYTGEMPVGFVKCNTKEIRHAAKELVRAGIMNLIYKGEKYFVVSYELYPETIKKLIELGKTFKFKYNKFWMAVPEMSITFGGDSEFTYNLIVGGEFLEVRPIKK